MQCGSCQLIYLNPRLTAASMTQLENESTVYAFSAAEAEQLVDDQLVPLFRYCQGFKRSRGTRVLDVGCNRGLLLEAARRCGWQPVGVEISPVAAERARADYGLTIYSSLAELAPGAQFDVIFMWHVVEHLPDPVDVLRQVMTRLAPGGVVAIQVPSFEYLEEFRQRGQATSLLCSVHNLYLTPASLRMIVERAGLHVLQISGDPENLLLTVFCSNEGPGSLRARIRRWLGR